MMSAPACEILAMDFFNDLRLCQGKKVIITFNVTGKILKAFPPVLTFGELMFLDHGPHGAIEDQGCAWKEACAKCHIV